MSPESEMSLPPQELGVSSNESSAANQKAGGVETSSSGGESATTSESQPNSELLATAETLNNELIEKISPMVDFLNNEFGYTPEQPNVSVSDRALVEAFDRVDRELSQDAMDKAHVNRDASTFSNYAATYAPMANEADLTHAMEYMRGSLSEGGTLNDLVAQVQEARERSAVKQALKYNRDLADRMLRTIDPESMAVTGDLMNEGAHASLPNPDVLEKYPYLKNIQVDYDALKDLSLDAAEREMVYEDLQTHAKHNNALEEAASAIDEAKDTMGKRLIDVRRA